MKTVRVIGIIGILLGIIAVMYGGLSYKANGETGKALFTLFSSTDKRLTLIPIVVGIAGIITGSSMFFERGKRN